MRSEVRQELKFLVRGFDYGNIIQRIHLNKAHFTEEFSPRTVNNIYFDSEDMSCYRDNLEGIAHRAKLRLRWYGGCSGTILDPNIELKAKINKFTKKKILKLPITLDMSDNWDNLLSQIYDNSDSNFRLYLESYSKPIVVNSYSRRYFRSMNGLVRLTYDNELRFFWQVGHHRPNLTFPSPSELVQIVEIKSDPSNIRLAQGYANGLPIIATKSSKYVLGVDCSKG